MLVLIIAAAGTVCLPPCTLTFTCVITGRSVPTGQRQAAFSLLPGSIVQARSNKTISRLTKPSI